MVEKKSCKPTKRSGGIYLIVLGIAMIVSILGICGVQLAHIQLRSVQSAYNRQRARVLAASAIEHAINIIGHDSNWRTTYKNGELSARWTLGADSFRWKLADDDGALTDDTSDPVWIYGYGAHDNAVWVARARARVDAGLPFEFLRTTLHAAQDIDLADSALFGAMGAPISTDSNLDLGKSSEVRGNAEATYVVGTGTVVGTTIAPAAKKGVPPRAVYHDYVARATALPFSGDLNQVVLAPGANEYGGGLNEDGVYLIDTAGADLELRNCRIHGTLLINAGAGRVRIRERCFLQPFRDDFPSLIIQGRVEFSLDSAGGASRLSESTVGHNFNPTGAPYGGSEDNDQSDTYPCEIQGLVHVIGDARFDQTNLVRGCVVVDGWVQVEDSPRIIHQSGLMDNPPLGYTDDPASTKMIIEPGSWSAQSAD